MSSLELERQMRQARNKKKKGSGFSEEQQQQLFKQEMKLKQQEADLKAEKYKRENPAMEAAIKRGKKSAEGLIKEGDFGRLGDKADVKEAMGLKKGVIGKQEDVMGKRQDVLDKRESQYGLRDEMISRSRKRADEGMGTEVMEAQRAKMREQMTQATQAGAKGLAGLFGGRQGAGIAAQQAGMQSAMLQGRAGIERDLFLANQAAKERGEGQLQAAIAGRSGEITAQGQDTAGFQSATAAYGQSVNDYTSAVGEMNTFDISQAAAEKTLQAQLGSQIGLTEMQTAASDRASKMAADAARAQAGGGGGKK